MGYAAAASPGYISSPSPLPLSIPSRKKKKERKKEKLKRKSSLNPCWSISHHGKGEIKKPRNFFWKKILVVLRFRALFWGGGDGGVREGE